MCRHVHNDFRVDKYLQHYDVMSLKRMHFYSRLNRFQTCIKPTSLANKISLNTFYLNNLCTHTAFLLSFCLYVVYIGNKYGDMRRLEKIKRFEITGHLLRIDANKKKKDDIRCDIIISQTPTVCLTPVVAPQILSTTGDMYDKGKLTFNYDDSLVYI